MLDEHTEEIEADLQETYRLELSGLFDGRITWRRFGVLLRQLGRSSRLAQALDPAAAWTIGEHLQALAVDALRGANWQRSRAKTAAPEPISRPGVTSQDDQLASLAEQLLQQRRDAQRTEGGDHA